MGLLPLPSSCITAESCLCKAGDDSLQQHAALLSLMLIPTEAKSSFSAAVPFLPVAKTRQCGKWCGGKRHVCAGMSDRAVGKRRAKWSAAPRAATCDLAEPHLNYFQTVSCSLHSSQSHEAGCQKRQQFGRFLSTDCTSVWQAVCTIWHPGANPREGAGQ